MTPCRNCGTAHPARDPCPPHQAARAAGAADRAAGLPPQDRYPRGIYGHADYALGYYGDIHIPVKIIP